MMAKIRRGHWGVSGGLLGVLGLLLLAFAYRAVTRPPIDLAVYLLGGSIVRSGGDDLYAAGSLSSQGLPFTYPPFAAVTFVPLTAAGLAAASLAILAVSVACVHRTCYLVIVRTGFCGTYRITVPTAVVAASVATLVMEPATSNLTLGQLNLVLCWAVVEDILGPRRRTTGMLVGLAAGIKLVPGLFVAYFVLTRQWRAARLSTVTAILTVGVGFVLLPGSSVTYFSTLGQLQNRVAEETVNEGDLSQVANQSVLGSLNRLIGPDVRALRPVISLALLIVAGATVLQLRGRNRPVDSVVVLALAGLLASPVSWTHHWVWTTPLVIVLLVRARSGGGGLVRCATAAPRWPVDGSSPAPCGWSWCPTVCRSSRTSRPTTACSAKTPTWHSACCRWATWPCWRSDSGRVRPVTVREQQRVDHK